MDVCRTRSPVAGSASCQRLEQQFGSNRDRFVEAEVDRAFLSEQAVQPERGFTVLLLRPEPQLDVNAPDHQDTALQLHFTDGFGHQTFIGSRNLTRLQRAPEGSGESTGRRGDNVVEGRGVRLERVGRDLVVLSDGPVHAENDWLALGRQVGAANRTLHSLDAHFGSICDLTHNRPPRHELYDVWLGGASQPSHDVVVDAGTTHQRSRTERGWPGNLRMPPGTFTCSAQRTFYMLADDSRRAVTDLDDESLCSVTRRSLREAS